MTIENCTVEFDRSRGILYVHVKEGVSVMRIQGLPRATKLDAFPFMDIRVAPEAVAYTPMIQKIEQTVEPIPAV